MRSYPMFLKVALQSLLYRKGSVLLTIFSIALSIFVLLGVEHVRKEAKSSFSNTVSGVDLIVGARSGEINLLLYSVFRVGNATNNISWQSYQALQQHPKVAWSIPISLGDSHKGFRVVGTEHSFFEHYQYGQQQAVEFMDGQAFSELYDVVLGSEVAKQLNYQLEAPLVLAHGIAKTSFSQHKDSPFKVSGILKPTGTPVDNALYVSLAAIEAIHKNWQGGVDLSASKAAKKQLNPKDLIPTSITATMLGLNSKMATFSLQRWINNYDEEALMAILPGVALSQLWQMMGMMEATLRWLSILIFASAILGLAAMLLASMRERKNELMILRGIGASPSFILTLLISEALLMLSIGIALGISCLYLLILMANEMLTGELGMSLSLNLLNQENLYLLAAIYGCSFIISLIPAIKAYRVAAHSKI